MSILRNSPGSVPGTTGKLRRFAGILTWLARRKFLMPAGILSAVFAASLALTAAAVDAPRVGQLVYNPASKTVYIVGSEGLYGFPNAPVFYSWGFNFNQIVPENSAEQALDQIGIVPVKKAGCATPLEQIAGACSGVSTETHGVRVGQLVFSPGNKTVYLVADGALYGFPNPQVFYSWSYRMEQIVPATGEEMALPQLGVIQAKLAGCSNPVRQLANDCGTGQATSTAPRVGELVLNLGNHTVYIVGSDGLYGIPNMDTLVSWGYQLNQVKPQNQAENTLSQVGIVPPKQGTCPTPFAQIAGNCGIGMANPASVYCASHGGKPVIQTSLDPDSSGQIGYCVFPDGSKCEEWSYYRGTCQPGNAPSSAVAVTSPAAGEQWPLGSAQTIRWTATSTVSKVNINLSSYIACLYGNPRCMLAQPAPFAIATGIDNTGSYSWNILNSIGGRTVAAGQYVIEVADAGNSGLSGSSKPFNITATSTAACDTTVAKLCPDGVTYVLRQGPNCDYAACPIAAATTTPVACTMDAKLCPDGITWVGRQGPNCEFAACPAATVTCPQLTPPAPGWCNLGTIVPQIADENNCPRPPLCLAPSSPPNCNYLVAPSCSNGAKPLYYFDSCGYYCPAE